MVGGNFSYIYQTGERDAGRTGSAFLLRPASRVWIIGAQRRRGWDVWVAGLSCCCRFILEILQPMKSEPIDGDLLRSKWTAFPSHNAPKVSGVTLWGHPRPEEAEGSTLRPTSVKTHQLKKYLELNEASAAAQTAGAWGGTTVGEGWPWTSLRYRSYGGFDALHNWELVKRLYLHNFHITIHAWRYNKQWPKSEIQTGKVTLGLSQNMFSNFIRPSY